MRTALVSPRSDRLYLRAEAVRNHGRNAIQIFSQDKLVEHKLASKTGSFVPELYGSQAGIRKTLVRLKTMFARSVEKQKPYVEYAEKPLLEIVDRQKFVLTVISRPQMLPASQRDYNSWGAGTRNHHLQRTHFTKLMTRYTRYLQVLCLKYALPFDLSLRHEIQMTPQHVRKMEMMGGAAADALQETEVQYISKITINLACWRYSPYEDYLVSTSAAVDPFPTVDDFLADTIRREGEAVAYDVARWTNCSLTSNRYPNVQVPRYRRYVSPEKMFFYIPQILQVLNSLTRQTNYVSSAFSIGAVEGS